MCNIDHLPYFRAQLDQVLQREGFTPELCSVDTGAGSALSDGFMSGMVRVRVREEGRPELVLLCKVPLENAARRAQAIGLFEREVRAYNELLPMLGEFQRERGVREEDGFFNVPRCFGAFCVPERLEAMLILEDLRERGFRMWNKYEPVDLKHTQLVMGYLGKLHAVSFALREQKPEVFRELASYKDSMLTVLEEGDFFVNMLRSMCDRAVGTLEVHEEFYREKVLDLQANLKEEIKRCVSAEFAEPYAVVGHGDCWINNCMFTYESDDSTPKDLNFVDWQICRYGSPAIDLVYFLFLGTDDQFRSEHYSNVIDVYYRSLCDHLTKLGGDPAKQFPRAELNRQLKAFGKFAFVMAILILPVICTPSEDLPDLDKTAEGVEKQDGGSYHIGANSEVGESRYRKRISGVIRDLVRFGYL
ncbi:hypothetical protein pipiens_007553 [Culex pipiens pipiens]|uniref:CHK kinase-like domain-containing protein n=1 Tax=Culex pipiens pipiens TaxID=38569 RepID=A0ABD1DM23_CULPP